MNRYPWFRRLTACLAVGLLLAAVPAPAPAQTGPPDAEAPSTSCPTPFSDVPHSSPYYVSVECLACDGEIQGYNDGTFRPNAPLTRSQLAKIVALGLRLTTPPPPEQQDFADVPLTHPFWTWIERLITLPGAPGYICGRADDPCAPPSQPRYFLPSKLLTRSETAEFLRAVLQGTCPGPTWRQSFADVTPSRGDWCTVEWAASAGVISGYPCGGPGEPCGSPALPYFRPDVLMTRGQAAVAAVRAFQLFGLDRCPILP